VFETPNMNVKTSERISKMLPTLLARMLIFAGVSVRWPVTCTRPRIQMEQCINLG